MIKNVSRYSITSCPVVAPDVGSLATSQSDGSYMAGIISPGRPPCSACSLVMDCFQLALRLSCMASEAGNTSVMMTVATSGEESTRLDPVCEPHSQRHQSFPLLTPLGGPLDHCAAPTAHDSPPEP